MPDETEFQEALDEAARYVTTIGDEVLREEVEGIAQERVRGQDYELTGHQCEGDDGSIYIVGGHPELRHLTVLYIFSLGRFVGSRTPDDLHAAILENLPDGELESDEEAESEEEATARRDELVGRELLDALDPTEEDAFESYLFMFTSSGDNSTFITRDDGTLDSLTVGNNIYPYGDDFSVRNFDDAVQSTVSAGRRGSNLIRRTLFVQPDEETALGASLELNFGW